MKLAQEGADVVINYQNTKENAQALSKLIDSMGLAQELEEITGKIDKMETKEQAKEISELIESKRCHSFICQANVSNMGQVNRMREEVIKKFGGVDILVNNAGIVRDKSFVKMTSDMWNDVLSVNLNGTFYCTKAFIDGMIEKKIRQDREYFFSSRENGQLRTGELYCFKSRRDRSYKSVSQGICRKGRYGECNSARVH